MTDPTKIAHRVVETYGLRHARREIAAIVLGRLARIADDIRAAMARGDTGAILECARRSNRASALGDAVLAELDRLTIH